MRICLFELIFYIFIVMCSWRIRRRCRFVLFL